jgi:hypothetical protein
MQTNRISLSCNKKVNENKMSAGYQIKDQKGLYYLTFQIVDWIETFTYQVYWGAS